MFFLGQKMPPSKLKLHKTTGKSSGPQKTPVIQPTESQGATALTASQEEQFQSELYWCINQLQQALSLGKLNSKQGMCLFRLVNIVRSFFFVSSRAY